MKRVLKFEVPLDDQPHEIKFPESGAILVGSQLSDAVCLWAIEGALPRKTRRFQVYGTGQPIHDDAQYVGSTQSGPFVWHVFEV